MDSRLAIDSAVLLLYFVLMISIGLYMGRKEENLADFALGGRRMPWWAVLASLIAAETTAATFFGTPGEGFTKKVDRKSTRLNSSHVEISYAVFCLKKK